MPIYLSSELENDEIQAERIRKVNTIIEPMLRQHSQTANGSWQLWQDEKGRPLLTLTISDPWGSAVADFTLEELDSLDNVRRRFYELIGEMINPRSHSPKKEYIAIQDIFASTEQLEELRRALGSLPDLENLGLRMHNQIRFLTNRPQYYLLTEFVIEVNAERAHDVREILEKCRFHLRLEKPLLEREGVRAAVKEVVLKHQNAKEAIPRFAVCFRIDDRNDIHLLEVAEDIPELEDGSLSGVGFDARDIIPGARSLIIYLTHPKDLQLARKKQPDHVFFRDLANQGCVFIYPDDNGTKFMQVFADLKKDI
jgi:hypothetical protein